jgi:hypothetical protein
MHRKTDDGLICRNEGGMEGDLQSGLKFSDCGYTRFNTLAPGTKEVGPKESNDGLDPVCSQSASVCPPPSRTFWVGCNKVNSIPAGYRCRPGLQLIHCYRFGRSDGGRPSSRFTSIVAGLELSLSHRCGRWDEGWPLRDWHSSWQ